MGMIPRFSESIFALSLSTQVTSLPRSAKTAPVTSPTYPVPTTQMFKVEPPSRAPGYQTTGLPRQSCAPRHSRRTTAGPLREDVSQQTLRDHHGEEEQEIVVGEEEEREPAALGL